MNNKTIYTLCLIFVILGFSQGMSLVYGDGTAAESHAVKPRAYAVLFYADWCSSCKALDPQLTKARAALTEEPVLFIQFDLTDEKTKVQTAMLAESLGLGKTYAEYSRGTGFLLLIDRATGKILQTVTKEDSTETIVAKVKNSIGG